MISLAGAIYLVIKEPVTDLLNRRIDSVKVEGEFRYLSRPQVERLISNNLNGSFLELDLESMKSVLENNPWVRRAAVQRQWPDSLRVRIFEQHPIARWGSSGFLNRSGDIIQVEEVTKLEGLPWLEGHNHDAARVMRRYQEVTRMLRQRGMELASLKQDERGAWSMELRKGVKLTVGRDSIMDKVQRFFLIYDAQLHDRWEEVAAVDLRYANGISVRWKQEKPSESN